MNNKDRLTDEQIKEINLGEVPTCPECSSRMRLRRSRYGLFYGCSTWPRCNSTHGAHPEGKPLGTPATSEVKQLRIDAHSLLDKRFGRKGYFSFLQKTLSLTKEEAHVAKLNKRQLEVVIETLKGGYDKI